MARGLDTYVGRPVTKIDVDTDGNWFVELVGDVRVINLDDKFKKPEVPSLDNLYFVSVVLSDEQTQMVLATVVNNVLMNEFRAVFSAVRHVIYDPQHQSTPFAPQAGNIEIEIPEYPVERENDGPIEPVQDERSNEEDTE